MTSKRHFFSLPILVIAALTAGCGSDDSADVPQEQPTAAEPADTTDTAPERGSTEVAYEPAYPTDVSEEGLSEEDATQQQSTHSLDAGEEHAHAEGEEHAHDGSDDDHDH